MVLLFSVLYTFRLAIRSAGVLHPDQITPDFMLILFGSDAGIFQLPGDPIVVKSFENFFKKVVVKVAKVASKVVTESR